MRGTPSRLYAFRDQKPAAQSRDEWALVLADGEGHGEQLAEFPSRIEIDMNRGARVLDMGLPIATKPEHEVKGKVGPLGVHMNVQASTRLKDAKNLPCYLPRFV